MKSLFWNCRFALPSRCVGGTFQPFNPSTLQPFNSYTSYTNHAGNPISGTVIALTAHTATFSNAEEVVTLPLAIFPPSVRRAITGAQKATTRSRQRAAQGLCTPEESSTFIAHTQSALSTYLDSQLSSGTITPAERQSILSSLP